MKHTMHDVITNIKYTDDKSDSISIVLLLLQKFFPTFLFDFQIVFSTLEVVNLGQAKYFYFSEMHFAISGLLTFYLLIGLVYVCSKAMHLIIGRVLRKIKKNGIAISTSVLFRSTFSF